MPITDTNANTPAGEASLWRRIGAAVFALIFGIIFGGLLSFTINFIPLFYENMPLRPFRDFFGAILSFVGAFIGCVIGIKGIWHISLRSFLFGSGRKCDIRTALIAGALMFAGLLAAESPSFKYFSLDNTDIPLILTNLLLCILLLWIQTTTEEILFRGFFLRIPYGNEIPKLPRGLLFAFISSIVFMVFHLANPEVGALSFGADLILGAASYFVGAFCMYICNLLIGGMEAGLIFHLINNFYCFFLVRARISALETPAIFINNAPSSNGVAAFIEEIVMYAPPLIYLILKKRSAKSS